MFEEDCIQLQHPRAEASHDLGTLEKAHWLVGGGVVQFFAKQAFEVTLIDDCKATIFVSFDYALPIFL